jgi:8-amino-7-oxononanoate synthase
MQISGHTVSCRSLDNSHYAVGIKFSGVRDWEQKILASAIQELTQNAMPIEKSVLKISVAKDTIALEAASLSKVNGSLLISDKLGENGAGVQQYPQNKFFYRIGKFSRRLEEVAERGLYFYLRGVDTVSEAKIKMHGRELIMFASNNYLGLTSHPRVKEAAIKAIRMYGTGSGCTGFIGRLSELHERLEHELARFKGMEAAMLFSTGFMANSGMVMTLFGEDDILILDEKSHVSIFQGCRFSKCRTRIYRHNDMESLEKVLRIYKNSKGKKAIITQGVFAVDGDIAKLPAIYRLAKEYDALTIVDENHATGTLGKEGRGSAEHFGLLGQIDIISDGLGKTLAGIGGYVAGSKEIIDYLKHFSKNFIYTTSLPPAVCATILAAISVIKEEPELRTKLWENATIMTSGLKELGFNLGACESHVIPIIIGNETKIFAFTKMLQELGVFVAPVVRHAVKRNDTRVRVTLMATHAPDDLYRSLEMFRVAGRATGII